MTARYPGTCATCAGPITRGSEIRHEGRGRTHHATCETSPSSSTEPDPFRYTRSRGYYGRDAGRCEDAPCCGCC